MFVEEVGGGCEKLEWDEKLRMNNERESFGNYYRKKLGI